MLKSTSGTEPPPLPHTGDVAPVKSKVALRLTASQGVDYHSTARTVYLSHHWGGHHRRMGHRTVVDTLYVVITAQVPLHIYVHNSFTLDVNNYLCTYLLAYGKFLDVYRLVTFLFVTSEYSMGNWLSARINSCKRHVNT